MRYHTGMIGHLTGTIIHSDLRSVVLDVGGVGYKIYTNRPAADIAWALPAVTKNKPVSFWTYLAVRENALDLYGFATKDELDFFELLLTISGIGPKSASNILGVASLSNLRQAISSGDTSHLTKISGIGKKVADKIVLELKDKIGVTGEEIGANLSGDVDALLALQSLGYSERDAREALKKSVGTTEEKVRGALKQLSK